METPVTASTPTIDELPLPADQRTQLKAFVATYRHFSNLAASAEAQRNRAAAAAELMADNAPIGERPSATAGLPSPTAATLPKSATRAMLLFIAPDISKSELVASTVARELGRDLLPVEMSRVVSKFIAETEKHLEEMFDVAGEDGAILFFNDADALFGSDGKASERHFADQEVGYLLHHIEGFNGVSILSIHAGTPVDADVLRRFTCVIRG